MTRTLCQAREIASNLSVLIGQENKHAPCCGTRTHGPRNEKRFRVNNPLNATNVIGVRDQFAPQRLPS